MGPKRERIGPPVGPPVLLSEKVHGVRRWEAFVDVGGDLRLGGYAERLWRAGGETTRAECLNAIGKVMCGHSADAPAQRCCCGLYSVHPWMLAGESWRRWMTPSRQLAVAGIVECWGTVQLHSEGIRAQYARPLRLVVIGAPLTSEYGRLVRRVAEAHEADVRAFTGVAGLARHCTANGLGLARETVAGLLESA